MLPESNSFDRNQDGLSVRNCLQRLSADIGVAPITQVTHVPDKNSNFQGGHLICYKWFSIL